MLHEVTIPATKKQETKKANNAIMLDMSEEKQNDIPVVIDVAMTMNLVQDKNDDDRNETECSSGGIKESHDMRFPIKASTYRLRKRRKVITYIESVCSDETKNSMDSDFET